MNTANRTLHFTVPTEADGQRADIFLAAANSMRTNPGEGEITRSAAQRLLAEGRVLLGESAITKNHRVKAGDILICEIPAPVPGEAIPEAIPLDIVYEDGDLLVVNKPRGLVVHPGAGNYTGTLVNALLHYCGDGLSGIGGVLRPGIVHRLDKDPSGLMVVAKNDFAHQALAAQLESRQMGRIYNAVVCGALKKESFRIDLPIGRHPIDRKKMAVLADTRFGTRAASIRAREAITDIKVLERYESNRGRFTLIAAKLFTGRTHQIRVHMAHIGHPVLGDLTYGTGRQPLLQKLNEKLGGQILHATQLKFTHPATGREMEFEAPWPEYFQKVVMNITSNR